MLAHALRRSAQLAALCVALAPSVAGASTLPTPGVEGAHCEHSGRDAPHLLVFGGWTVRPEWAWHWLKALQAEAFAGQAMGSLCAVRGPRLASFEPPDIDVEALAATLRTQLGDAGARAPLHVIAHSSGSFVAQRLLHALRAQGAQTLLARVHYANLDGDGGSGPRELDADLVAQLAQVRVVLARDGIRGSESANANAMRALAARYPVKVRLVELDASHSGCQPQARWCLHMVPITHRPHDPRRFDLARDYGGLGAERPVQTGYLTTPADRAANTTPPPAR